MSGDNILQFRLRPAKPVEEPLYWMCDCGSSTFYSLSDGLLECTGWRPHSARRERQ